jgi:hypothetical protein
VFSIEGTQIKNPQVLADTFNDYFSKVLDESVSNITKQQSYLEYLVHISATFRINKI